jgi:hypothetical protein
MVRIVIVKLFKYGAKIVTLKHAVGKVNIVREQDKAEITLRRGIDYAKMWAQMVVENAKKV